MDGNRHFCSSPRATLIEPAPAVREMTATAPGNDLSEFGAPAKIMTMSARRKPQPPAGHEWWRDLTPKAALTQLYESLDRRRRPEDVAGLVLAALAGQLSNRELGTLSQVAAVSARWFGQSSMSDDFARPVGGQAQVAATGRVFAIGGDQPGTLDPAVHDALAAVDPADPAALLEFVRRVGTSIGATPERLDFRSDRLNREARAEAGIELSKRQYNRRFRVLQRVAAKASTLEREQAKRRLTLTARAGFAATISEEQFAADPNAACFVAYYTAKRKLRREFTLSGRDNPFDQVAKLLMDRCEANRQTDWWMIAQVYPTSGVLRRLPDERRGELLGRWSAAMSEIAGMLAALWASSEYDREGMIVQRGNDSSTWNLLAGAYNAARAAWLGCLEATNSLDALDVACPGKVMMLIAADLAAWHRLTGGGLHPDTAVWARLPLPWDVLSGRATCTRDDVLAACAEAGVDPVRNGWTVPRPPGRPGRFRPTPELVHGVAVADPVWASLLRSAGVFSGKRIKDAYRDDLRLGIPEGVVTSDLPGRPAPGGQADGP